MSDVLFADARVREMMGDKTLPAKFKRLLAKLDLPAMVKDRSVAIKMHFGGSLSYTTIHPLFIRMLVQACKDAGASSVAIMDNDTWAATGRGYTPEVIGAPVVSCDGWSKKYLYRRRIGYKTLQSVEYGGNAWDADVFIDLSHLKAHGECGFGGAIKNIAMGCVSGRSRAGIHALEGGIVWDRKNCTHCKKCIEECPNHANKFTEEGNYEIFYHHCTFCQHCILVCPHGALKLDKADFDTFQEGLARVTATFLKHFAPDRVLFLNFLLDITIFCDCWGLSTPSLVPDIGILAGRDIIAVERASLGKIKVSKLMPEGLPIGRKMARKTGHLFNRIHAKDPYVQVNKLAAMGFGPGDYRIVEVG